MDNAETDPCVAINGDGIVYREFSCDYPLLEPFYLKWVQATLCIFLENRLFPMSLHCISTLQQHFRMESNVYLLFLLSAVLKRNMILFLCWDGWVNILWFQLQLLLCMGSWLFGGNMLWRKDWHGIGETQWHFGISVLVSFLGLECSERHLNWQATCTTCPSEISCAKIPEKRMDPDHLVSGYSCSFWVNSRTYKTISSMEDPKLASNRSSAVNSSIPSSLSFTRNRWSSCIGTITLRFCFTAGILMWLNRHLEYFL